MTIHKKIEFSGVFEKAHEDDDNPIQIDNAIIYLNTDGSVFLEVSGEIEEKVSFKQLIEADDQRELPSKNINFNDPFQMQNFIDNQKHRKIIKKAYHGDYQISGFCLQESQIKAITDKNIPLKIGSSLNKNHEQSATSKIKLRNLCLCNDEHRVNGDEFIQVSYGLSNIDIFSKFEFSLDEIGADVLVKPIPISKQQKYKELSAEVCVTQKITGHTDNQISIDTYVAWILSLLSFVSGRKVNEIYRRHVLSDNAIGKIKENWSGQQMTNISGMISVLQTPHISLFFKKCSTQINKKVFIDQGLGLALLWYVDSFDSKKCEVNFLLLCTVFETLNKKYLSQQIKKSAPQKILPSPLHKKIRKKILRVIKEFELEIKDEEENIRSQYTIFKNKFLKKFNQGDLNQITNLNASAQEMLDTYKIMYKDLFPNLEFIKARQDIVHKGWSDKDMILEYFRLSNLAIRIFLGLLKYEGVYIERDVDDPFYGLKYGEYTIEK